MPTTGLVRLFQTARRPLQCSVLQQTLAFAPHIGYEFHRDAEVHEFMDSQQARFRQLFHGLRQMEHKIDLWRYLYGFVNGGIYLDADSTFLSRLDVQWLQSYHGVFIYDAFFDVIYNGFFFTSPRNPILWETAEKLVELGPNASVDDYFYGLRVLRQKLEFRLDVSFSTIHNQTNGQAAVVQRTDRHGRKWAVLLRRRNSGRMTEYLGLSNRSLLLAHVRTHDPRLSYWCERSNSSLPSD